MATFLFVVTGTAAFRIVANGAVTLVFGKPFPKPGTFGLFAVIAVGAAALGVDAALVA